MTVFENISVVRSWILNGYGKCEFPVPYMVENPTGTGQVKNPILTLENFQFGNFIHIEHIPTLKDEGASPTGKLPDWVGIILPNRTWNSDSVRITAYTAEALLAYRALPYVTINKPAGPAFAEILGYANTSSLAKNYMLVREGEIITDGVAYTDDLRTNAYDHIKKLINFAKLQWCVRGVIMPESYALVLLADCTRERETISSIRLTTKNTEDQDPLFTEQGTIINDVFAYTQANTAADRKVQEVINQESVDLYGPFQANLVYVGQHDVTSINEAAANGFGGFSGPAKLFKRVALDEGELFSHLKIGNSFLIDEPNVGFNPAGGFGIKALVKIVSMSYNDEKNKVDMSVEVRNRR